VESKAAFLRETRHTEYSLVYGLAAGQYASLSGASNTQTCVMLMLETFKRWASTHQPKRLALLQLEKLPKKDQELLRRVRKLQLRYLDSLTNYHRTFMPPSAHRLYYRETQLPVSGGSWLTLPEEEKQVNSQATKRTLIIIRNTAIWPSS
jgi:hypothetical protein